MPRSKKIKVFLGAYTNYTNAQNLNCRALAHHLDKDKFIVYTLDLYSGDLSTISGSGIHLFRCFRPHSISKYFGYMWGIWCCHVAYLPKGELWQFNRLLLKIFRKRSFCTHEAILDDKAVQQAIQSFGNFAHTVDALTFTARWYPITNFLSNYNKDKHGIVYENKTLYLGVDSDRFKTVERPKQMLQQVICIASLIERKNLYDYLKLAQKFPEIKFLMAGNGPEKKQLEKYIHESNILNVQFLGTISHNRLSEILPHTQLHILPSRSEGFPKVTLETAAAGVPSLVYNDYGAGEWITHDKNGWVVHSFDDMVAIIKSLQIDHEKLEYVSNEAIKLAETFDWKVKVKEWEGVIKNCQET